MASIGTSVRVPVSVVDCIPERDLLHRLQAFNFNGSAPTANRNELTVCRPPSEGMCARNLAWNLLWPGLAALVPERFEINMAKKLPLQKHLHRIGHLCTESIYWTTVISVS